MEQEQNKDSKEPLNNLVKKFNYRNKLGDLYNLKKMLEEKGFKLKP